MNVQKNLIATAGQGLVNSVVQNFINQMMKPALLTVSDIHIGALAHRRKTLQNFYVAGIVNRIAHNITSLDSMIPGKKRMAFRPQRGQRVFISSKICPLSICN